LDKKRLTYRTYRMKGQNRHLVFVLIFLLASLSSGAEIFVDNQLSDDCIGTYSIAHRDNSGFDGDAYNTCQEAADVVEPGDIVYCREGTYQDICTKDICTFIRISRSGSAGNPITFQNYNNEKVIMKGVGFEDHYYDDPSWQGNADHSRETLILVEADYIHIRGLELTGSLGTGIHITGSYNLLEECTAHDNWGTHFSIGGRTLDNVQGNTLRHLEGFRSRHGGGMGAGPTTTIRNNQGQQYIHYHMNNTIEGCLFYNNGRHADLTKVYIVHGDTTGGGNSDFGGFNKNCADMVDLPEYPETWGVENWAPNNVFRGNIGFGNTDDGLDVSFADSFVEDNIMFNNGPMGNRGYKILRSETFNLTYRGNVAFGSDDYDMRGSDHSFYNNLVMYGTAGFSPTAKNNLAELDGSLSCSGDCTNNWDVNTDGSAGLANLNFMFNNDPYLEKVSHPGLPDTFNLDFPADWSVAMKVAYLKSRVREAFSPAEGSPLVDAGIVIDGYHNPNPGEHPGENCREWYGAAPDIGAYEVALRDINDLSVLGTSQNSVTITWTAVGGGNYREPTRYDIRYADSSITEANWDAATQVQGEPVPGDFGDAQSFTITGLNPGATYYVAMKTGDDAGRTSALSNIASGTTATSGNHPPVFEPIGEQSVKMYGLLSFSISATDPDGDAMTYSATNIPSGADFDPASQTFTWIPTDDQAGTYRVTFEVTDGQLTASETITITIFEKLNSAPELAPIGDKSVDENASLSFSVSATDPDEDDLIYSATGLPNGANFANQTFSWTPTDGQAGSYSVTFTVSDGALTDSEQIEIVVTTPNQPPIADADGPYYCGAGQITFDGAGSTDPDPGETQALEYRWDFENDGMYDTAWSADPTAKYTYPNCQAYTVTLQVRDIHGATDTDTAQVVAHQPMQGLHIDEAKITWGYASEGTFKVTGSFQLPNGYEPADLEKAALLHIEVAGAQGNDKVFVGGSSLFWMYYDITFGRGDDSLGQGVDIKRLRINWSSRKGQFHIEGELSLDGVGPNTQPPEAVIMLEFPVAPHEQAGSVAGEKKAEFEMSGGNTWVLSGQGPADDPDPDPPSDPPDDPPDDDPGSDDGDDQPPADDPEEPSVDLTAGISFMGMPPVVAIAGSGVGISLQLEVTNAGDAALGSGQSVEVGVYARPADATDDSQDTLLTTLDNQLIHGLAAGSSKTFSTVVSLPKTLPGGEYVLAARVDTTDAVAESDETNNCGVTDDSIRLISLGMNWPF
jgi:PKD repeat protein